MRGHPAPGIRGTVMKNVLKVIRGDECRCVAVPAAPTHRSPCRTCGRPRRTPGRRPSAAMWPSSSRGRSAGPVEGEGGAPMAEQTPWWAPAVRAFQISAGTKRKELYWIRVIKHLLAPPKHPISFLRKCRFFGPSWWGVVWRTRVCVYGESTITVCFGYIHGDDFR